MGFCLKQWFSESLQEQILRFLLNFYPCITIIHNITDMGPAGVVLYGIQQYRTYYLVGQNFQKLFLHMNSIDNLILYLVAQSVEQPHQVGEVSDETLNLGHMYRCFALFHGLIVLLAPLIDRHQNHDTVQITFLFGHIILTRGQPAPVQIFVRQLQTVPILVCTNRFEPSWNSS